MTTAVPPGPARSWVEMLPAPWDADPEVVVVMAPTGAQFQSRGNKDESQIYGCMLVGPAGKHTVFGLQMLKPEKLDYITTERMFREQRVRMAMPAHIGRVSEIPQRLLASQDFAALLFLKSDMSEPYLNTRHTAIGMVRKENN